ncbi:DNA topoisomerase 3 [Sporobolomyces salmoneus]|uniref:DNA topoisomerase 3 n=1 Tax=Sporobolomyces salmoneus TaxID=183962 RepID=UPI003179AFD7
MVQWLCVAEKPSIAKSITQILSGGNFQTRDARHPPWIKNYNFSYRMGNGPGFTNFVVTAVAGHLTSNDFDDAYRGWQTCDPVDLFDARVKTFVTQDRDHKGIEQNLTTEARKATHLMIWTDCDREGEFIGSVVAEVCRKANPRIVVKRARFSAIIPAQINQACRNPVDLDMAQANAVAARMELDLRVGAIFTRTQSLELQKRVNALADMLISYGPCQFPTLGFVVDQYERVQAFIPEPFWHIHVGIVRDDSTTSFTWRRGRLYDHPVAQVIFDMCEAQPTATVLSQQTKPTQKWKPLPLTTVELQKTGSRLLRMTPKRILEIAEQLYQKGILSYPRTETDQFDRDFNFHELIQKQTGDGAWGQFADNLLNANGFERPRNGKKNDKAHPPIHPTSYVNNLTGDDKRVYELIVRRFLGCCSKNARGSETTVEIEIAGEHFSAKGLIVRERNYLDVYIYDKWTGNYLPDFQIGEQFESDELELKEGTTSQPNLLTEADLVSLMDKNGIGTDATIAEHIAKIIDREYVMKQKEGRVEYLLPSTLGIGLVKAYDRVGLENSLTKPHLRRLTEQRMVSICEGTKTKAEVVAQTLEEYREVFVRTRQQMIAFVAAVREYVEGQAGAAGANGNGRGGGGGGGGRRGGRGNDSDDEDDSDAGDPPQGAAARQRGRGRGRGTAATPTRGKGRGASAGATRGGKTTAAKRKRNDDDDGPSGYDNDGSAPNCKCDLPAVSRVVSKEGGNKGRSFWGCSKPMDESCKFFEWQDEPNGGGGGAVRGPARPEPKRRPPQQAAQRSGGHGGGTAQVLFDSGALRCDCDLTPKLLTVSKEGPNQGRTFFKCPSISKTSQCGMFCWADEAPQVTSGGGGGASGFAGASNSGGGASDRNCFNCGQDGHWAKDCPSSASRSGGGAVGPSRGSAGGGQSGACFKCGEEGHWSSNCPNQPESGNGGSGGGGGGSNYSCFKCGEPGHFSNACPDESGQTGYSAGSRGRGASRARGSSRGRARGAGRGRARGGGRGRGRGRADSE